MSSHRPLRTAGKAYRRDEGRLKPPFSRCEVVLCIAQSRIALRRVQLFRGGDETRPVTAAGIVPSSQVNLSDYERRFDLLGNPFRRCFDDANACSVQTIDQDVRPTLAIDFGDRKPGRWQPK